MRLRVPVIKSSIVNILTIILFTLPLSAQSIGGGIFGIPGSPRSTTFANLGTPLESQWRWCSDCQATSPCTSGGGGAFAYRVDTAWNCTNGSAGGGGISGPVSSTDNAIVRWDGTGGNTVQDSLVTISDSGLLTAVGGVFNAAPVTIGASAVQGTIKLFDGAGTSRALQIASPAGTGPAPVRTMLINNSTWNANRTITYINEDMTLVGATNTQILTNKTYAQLLVTGGVTSSTGVQHVRAASCTTGSLLNDSCDTTVTWPVAFADTSYTAIATLDTPSGGLVFILSTKNKTTTTIDVTLVTLTAAASGGTINLIGFHD